jgi:hypothetical protein
MIDKSSLPVKYFLWTLLGLHAGWILFHMILISFEQINPWKLGGYAMYTTPEGIATITVSTTIGTTSVTLPGIDTFGYRTQMGHIQWYCLPVHEGAIEALFDDNPILLKRDFSVTTSQSSFYTAPLRLEPFVVHKVSISWQSETRYTLRYDNPRCEDQFVAQYNNPLTK